MHQVSGPCIHISQLKETQERKLKNPSALNITKQKTLYGIATSVFKCYAGVYLNEADESVTDCSMADSHCSPSRSKRSVALFCRDVAVAFCSRRLCVELHLGQIQLVNVKIRIPRAFVISLVVESQLIHSSFDHNCRQFLPVLDNWVYDI